MTKVDEPKPADGDDVSPVSEHMDCMVPMAFGEAMVRRTATFIANCVFVAIGGAIGWSLGVLIPPDSLRRASSLVER